MKVTTRTLWQQAGALAIGLALMVPMLAGAAEGVTLESARREAVKGNARALYELGKRYAWGDGAPQDYGKAAEYLRQAADRGYALAENDLGAFYAKGLGVKQDYVEAAQLYRRAAEKGEPWRSTAWGEVIGWGAGWPLTCRSL